MQCMSVHVHASPRQLRRRPRKGKRELVWDITGLSVAGASTAALCSGCKGFCGECSNVTNAWWVRPMFFQVGPLPFSDVANLRADELLYLCPISLELIFVSLPLPNWPLPNHPAIFSAHHPVWIDIPSDLESNVNYNLYLHYWRNYEALKMLYLNTIWLLSVLSRSWGEGKNNHEH